MEQVLARFPHLGDKIFQNLNSHTLIRCKEASRTCENFMKAEKSGYLHTIQTYTNFSTSLIKKTVDKFGGSIIVVSLLREIFGSNRPLAIGWDEAHTPEGQKYYMNHFTKSTQWEDPRSAVSLRMHQNSQHVVQITGILHQPPTLRLGIGYNPLEYNILRPSEFETFLNFPIPWSQLTNFPQHTNNQITSQRQRKLILNNFTRKYNQRLLHLHQQKWLNAISKNFLKCDERLLLSFFCLELHQKEEKQFLGAL